MKATETVAHCCAAEHQTEQLRCAALPHAVRLVRCDRSSWCRRAQRYRRATSCSQSSRSKSSHRPPSRCAEQPRSAPPLLSLSLLLRRSPPPTRLRGANKTLATLSVQGVVRGTPGRIAYKAASPMDSDRTRVPESESLPSSGRSEKSKQADELSRATMCRFSPLLVYSTLVEGRAIVPETRQCTVHPPYPPTPGPCPP